MKILLVLLFYVSLCLTAQEYDRDLYSDWINLDSVHQNLIMKYLLM